MLICALISDHRRNRLPDLITLPLLLAGLLFSIKSDSVSLHESAAGALIGYLFFRIWHDLQTLRRGFAGVGLGDAKLLSALGAWFGWQSLPFLLTGASALTLMLYPKRFNKPFGVGLCMSAFVVMTYRLLFL